MKAFGSFLLACALGAVPCHVATVFHFENRTLDPSNPRVEKTQITAQGECLKMDIEIGADGQPESSMIFDNRTRQMTIVDHAGRNFMVMDPETIKSFGTQIHTAPEAFGKVMTEIQPRMAVAYHFFKDFDTTAEVNDRIRTTYDGPLSLAEDFMVWNVTKDDIRVRMAVVEEHTWAPPLAGEPKLPQKDDREQFSKNTGIPVEALLYSDFVKKGRWSEVDEALRKVYEEASEAMGRKFEYPTND